MTRKDRKDATDARSCDHENTTLTPKPGFLWHQLRFSLYSIFPPMITAEKAVSRDRGYHYREWVGYCDGRWYGAI